MISIDEAAELAKSLSDKNGDKSKLTKMSSVKVLNEKLIREL